MANSVMGKRFRTFWIDLLNTKEGAFRMGRSDYFFDVKMINHHAI